MANTVESHRLSPGFAQRLDGAVEHAKQTLRRARTYRKTLSELQGLSDRELADLGLSRSMLRKIAKAAAAEAN